MLLRGGGKDGSPLQPSVEAVNRGKKKKPFYINTYIKITYFGDACEPAGTGRVLFARDVPDPLAAWGSSAFSECCSDEAVGFPHTPPHVCTYTCSHTPPASSTHSSRGLPRRQSLALLRSSFPVPAGVTFNTSSKSLIVCLLVLH